MEMKKVEILAPGRMRLVGNWRKLVIHWMAGVHMRSEDLFRKPDALVAVKDQARLAARTWVVL